MRIIFILYPILVSDLYAQAKIESPLGGWRSGKSGTNVLQQVHYPASRVSSANHLDMSNRIKGRIDDHPKGGKPATLIVNGLDMPIDVVSGKFDRPYSFSKGNNSVEIRSGQNRHSVNFYETNSSLTPTRLRVLLSWDSDNTDIDLHLITPDGKHCFYGNRTLENGTALDVDVTSGYGPEIISVPSPMVGTYMVFVNYYGGRQKGHVTTTKVSIVTKADTPDEKIESFVVPLRAAGELSLIKTFRYE